MTHPAPISFVGTGENLNLAIDNGLERAASVLGLSVPEVKNRTTINGGLEIGRYPGTATVTFLTPVKVLEKALNNRLKASVFPILQAVIFFYTSFMKMKLRR